MNQIDKLKCSQYSQGWIAALTTGILLLLCLIPLWKGIIE